MNEIKLRPHQQTAIDALRQGFRDGHTRQIYVAPTGAGKTVAAAFMLQGAGNAGAKSAMVLDRIVLCEQTSAQLDRYGIGHGVLQAGHWRYRPHENIQVCSAQTLEKRGFMPGAKLLILDECHSLRAETRKMIESHPNMKVIGLTATPFTAGLGEIYTNIVQTVTTSKLTDDGLLCPLKVYVAKEIDMTGAAKVAGEWSQREAGERGVIISGDVVSEWVEKTHKHFGGPRKTLVFGASVAHCEDLARKFQEAGYNFVAISYRDESEFTTLTLKEFAKPDSSIVGLIAVDKLSKGFDTPDICIGVSARPFSKSLSSHVQQMGRVMRAHPSKEFSLWICHSGNYLRFRETWDDIRENGVSRLRGGHTDKGRTEPTEKIKKESVCPDCKALRPPGALSCAACGFTFQSINKVEVAPAEMEELDARQSGKIKKVTMDDKQEFYSGLLEHARIKGYKRGWAANNYREKFGVWPQTILHIEGPIVPSVANWILKKNIAWARAKR